jgi:hypothetical protein
MRRMISLYQPLCLGGLLTLFPKLFRFGGRKHGTRPALAYATRQVVRRLLNEKRPQLRRDRAGAATFSRFVSTIPRERWIRLSATLQVPKSGPDAGLGGSTILRVLFTIEPTLPPVPASIATPFRAGHVWLSQSMCAWTGEAISVSGLDLSGSFATPAQS